MRTKILIGLLIIGVGIACKKNQYNTKPTLTIKSLSSTVIPKGGTLIIEFEVKDKEGDITDSANLFQRKIRINQRPDETLTNLDSLHFIVPAAPNSQDGIIQLNLDYDRHLVTGAHELENDTIILRYALTDRGGYVSDSVSTEPIVVIR